MPLPDSHAFPTAPSTARRDMLEDYNSARADDGNELIATLFEVVRIERDYPEFEFRERKRSAVSTTADSRPGP